MEGAVGVGVSGTGVEAKRYSSSWYLWWRRLEVVAVVAVLVLVAGEWLRQHAHTGFAECHKSNRLKGMMIVIVAR